MKVPFFSFEFMNGPIRERSIDVFSETYDDAWYVLGKGVAEFETNLANHIDVGYAIGVASGFDALVIALKALGLGKGDEVIVPANTYIATWLAVSAVGATIIPVDPNMHSFNLDPDDIVPHLTSQTKAMLPVHLYGRPCRMDAIMTLARNHSLYVIEDNSQAIGALYMGAFTGSFGIVNGTSLYPGKNLGALGDAGVITTDSNELDEFCRVYRNYGSQKKYYNRVRGMNSRLDELQARLLSLRLTKLDEWNKDRGRVAARYIENLSDVQELTLPLPSDDCFSCVWHQFVVQVNDREALMSYLLKKGIGTLVHYPLPPHKQEAYSDTVLSNEQFPISERLAETVLSLPMYPGLSDGSIDYVCDTIRGYYGV